MMAPAKAVHWATPPPVAAAAVDEEPPTPLTQPVTPFETPWDTPRRVADARVATTRIAAAEAAVAQAQAEDPEAGEADGADAEAEPRGALMKLLPELRARLDAIDSDVRQIETAGHDNGRRPTRPAAAAAAADEPECAAAAAAAASADEPEWLKSAAERLSVSPSPVPPPPQEEEGAAKAPAAIVARHVEPLEEVTKAVAQITTSVSSRRVARGGWNGRRRCGARWCCRSMWSGCGARCTSRTASRPGTKIP